MTAHPMDDKEARRKVSTQHDGAGLPDGEVIEVSETD